MTDDTVTHGLADDPVLAPLVERHGRLELQVADDPFARLVVAVVNQQLSIASAAAIRKRLFEEFEVSPRALREADPAALATVGLSGRKIEYVKGIAETFERGALTREAFAALTDEQVIDRLVEIRGVGAWTAKIFLMFALGRPDVFPVEDLGIREGMRRLYGDLTIDEMIAIAERWRPERSRACLYIWRARDDPA